jgi:hypothetical protein
MKTTKDQAFLMGRMARQSADILDEAARTEDDAKRDTLVNLAIGQLERVKAHGVTA